MRRDKELSTYSLILINRNSGICLFSFVMSRLNASIKSLIANLPLNRCRTLTTSSRNRLLNTKNRSSSTSKAKYCWQMKRIMLPNFNNWHLKFKVWIGKLKQMTFLPTSLKFWISSKSISKSFCTRKNTIYSWKSN